MRRSISSAPSCMARPQGGQVRRSDCARATLWCGRTGDRRVHRRHGVRLGIRRHQRTIALRGWRHVGTDPTRSRLEYRWPSSRARRDFPMHYETHARDGGTAETLFSHLDDHNRLSGHMSKSSWMMAAHAWISSSTPRKDRLSARGFVSKGRALASPLFVEEVVTERTPPLRKAWQTARCAEAARDRPYRMGFEIIPYTSCVPACVFSSTMRCQAPGLCAGSAGSCAGGFYARWCTEKMADDAAQAFARSAPTADHSLSRGQLS